MSAAENTRLFVYGTLLRGEANHGLIARGLFIREARTTPSYTLISLGAFPGLVTGGSLSVVGELYEVTPQILAGLDRLEGHPRFYCRSLITLNDSSSAEAYLLPTRFAATYPHILSGDWKQHRAATVR